MSACSLSGHTADPVQRAGRCAAGQVLLGPLRHRAGIALSTALCSATALLCPGGRSTALERRNTRAMKTHSGKCGRADSYLPNHIQDCSTCVAAGTLPPVAPAHNRQFCHHPGSVCRQFCSWSPRSHLSFVFGLLQWAGVAQLVAQQAERADAVAVLAAEELKELVVLRALPLLQVPHRWAQLMVAEGRAVAVRPQVLGAEGGHAGEAGLRGGRLQTAVAVDGGCRLPLFLLTLIVVLVPGPTALQLLYHPAKHRVLAELRAAREGGAALRAAEVLRLVGPGELQAGGAEVVPAGHRHGDAEDAEADGARQLLFQRQQVRLRPSFGQRRHPPAAAARSRRNETRVAAFPSITWRFPAPRAARRVRPGLRPAGATAGTGRVRRGQRRGSDVRGGAMRAGTERGRPEPRPAGGSRVRAEAAASPRAVPDRLLVKVQSGAVPTAPSGMQPGGRWCGRCRRSNCY